MLGLGFTSVRSQRCHWYVDSVQGSDTNSGKTAGKAFLTLSALVGKVVDGQRVGLASGSHWREQLTVTAKNITIKAYGSGAKPLLDPSDVVPPASWSKTDGYTNIYQTTVTLAAAASNNYLRIWEDGTRLNRVASLALCDSTPGSLYVADDTVLSPVLYINASDSSNPGANGKTYEFPKRMFGIFCDTAGNKLIGLKSWRNLAADGSFKIGVYNTAIDCQADDGQKHNFFVRLGCTLINCTAYDSHYNLGSSLFILYDAVTGVETATFINCTAAMAEFVAGGLRGSFGAHTASGDFANVTFENCTITNCNEGFSAGNVTNITVNGGRATNTDAWIIFWGNGTVTGFTGSNDNGIVIAIGGIQIAPATANSSIVIRDSSFNLGNTANMTIIKNFGGTINGTIDVQRCTGICTGTGNSFLSTTIAGASVISRNNTMNTTSYYVAASGAGATVDSDNNTYQGNTTGTKFRLGATNYTYAAWKLTGQDANSTP